MAVCLSRVRVVAADGKEHEANLKRVMIIFQDNGGITLNYDKCEIGVRSMTYMGGIFSGEGLKVPEERVKAIVQEHAPKISQR